MLKVYFSSAIHFHIFVTSPTLGPYLTPSRYAPLSPQSLLTKGREERKMVQLLLGHGADANSEENDEYAPPGEAEA
jgi:hypothetical protein